MSDGQLALEGLGVGESPLPPNAPVGLRFIADAISTSEEASLLAAVDGEPWMTSMSRRVQHYGWRYDYKSRRIARDSYLGPLPEFLAPLRTTIRRVASFDPDQAIVNEYVPGQGIAPHVDCEPCFGPVVAMVGLGSDVQMDFEHRSTGEVWSMRFARRGVLVLSQDARFDWTHSIAKRRNDSAWSIRRARRVSITFRKVLPPSP